MCPRDCHTPSVLENEEDVALNDHLQKEGESHGSGRNNAAKGGPVGQPARGNIIS